MEPGMNVDGRDIDLKLLIPLQKRDNMNFKTHGGFRRIMASIRAIGLIEPLSVYQDGDVYVILDGYLRFQACERLGIESVPCIVYKEKQAYTFNRNVNRLTPYQEMRMLRKSLESIDEPTIAQTFGMTTIHHRLAPNLMKQLHPDVVKAFQENLIARKCAQELTTVVPDRQKEILQQMRQMGDFGNSFCKALVMQTPEEQRDKRRTYRLPWAQTEGKKKDMVARLEHAGRQQEFYTNLYRQYSTDLMKLSFYIRKLLTNTKIEGHLRAKHPDILARFTEVLDLGAPTAETAVAT